MASFNLGRIKGDKGDPGDRGPVGATGPKGDKGDTGERGTDGMTPVFAVGETVTLNPGEDAYVHVDSSNPGNPVLTFRIPRGRDGKDQSGDMIAAIYDTKGIKKDFYEFCESLFEKCMKASGGNLGGALKAAESSLSESCVRNISVSYALPQNGAEGDLCIITNNPDSKKLGDCSVGTTVIIEEDGREVPYILTAKDYHKLNSVTLLRKNVFGYDMCFDHFQRGKYLMSDIDMWLETIYRNLLPEKVRKSLVPGEVEYQVNRKCFLLGKEDFSNINYLKTESNRISYRDTFSDKAGYMLRTVDSYLKIICVSTSGTFTSSAQSEKNFFRPTFVLPADFIIQNTVWEEKPAVKLPEICSGIYLFANGKWEECALL